LATLLNTSTTPITVEEYHSMTERGVLTRNDRVELLEGVILEKPRVNPPHRISTDATREALGRIVPLGWYVSSQTPITLSTSEPEPDVAVIRGKTRDYLHTHPGSGDVGLVVEIADSSADRDRILKKRIYAAAGIPWYWVLDVNKRTLETFSDPRAGDYTKRAIYNPGQSVELTLDGEPSGALAVSDLLP
jgi:Uma2 family endonuclease